MVATVSDREFNEKVLRSANPVLVAFRAAGCEASLALLPRIEQIASKYEGRVTTVAVEVEHSQAISRRFQVTRVPVTMLISDGKVVDFIGGMTDEENISKMVERRLEPVIHVGEFNFSVEVLESSIPALVHFGASWCGASQRMAVALREVGERFRTRAKVTRVEFGAENAQLCSRHGVIRVPTTSLFVGGRMEDQIFGYTSVENMTGMLNRFML